MGIKNRSVSWVKASLWRDMGWKISQLHNTGKIIMDDEQAGILNC